MKHAGNLYGFFFGYFKTTFREKYRDREKFIKKKKLFPMESQNNIARIMLHCVYVCECFILNTVVVQ